MRLSNKIPELGKLLQRWKIEIFDGKAPSRAFIRTLSLALGVFNVVTVCVAAILPWYGGIPLVCAAMLWNILMAVSIGKQIAADQISIEKNRSLFKRFQNTTRYFESILQDTSDIIISLDRDYLILKFNRGAQNHFGYSQEEIVGKPFEMLFSDPADKERMQPTDEGDGSASAEILMKKRDGRKITANMCVSKMRDGGFVVTAQDITERKYLEEQLQQKSEQLKKLAITDDLTALYNSRHFYNVIRSELSRLKRHSDRKLAIIYMDVDKFKEYNDAEGHQMGDGVLRSLGEVIQACIRKDVDAGFRYGGDEFVVILPDTDMGQAQVAAERIQNQFCGMRFGNTSLSIGIAEARDDDDEKTLVRRADFAMYTSKKGGKKRITLATEDYPEQGASPDDTVCFSVDDISGGEA
ncbi:MAG: sensor domain-containing diguanylate cyclase [Chitinispirillia bacterium]|nr:sensor domain-containing diguanylate cyclase [Chitinispirillia bacterium]MCL2269287.1 sensor domain-containing diguanylate cyclase [Chitinispirillia bacterium]